MSEITYYQFDKIAKFIDYRGKTPKKTESGIPLITAKNIKFGYLSVEPKEYISKEGNGIWNFFSIVDLIPFTVVPVFFESNSSLNIFDII